MLYPEPCQELKGGEGTNLWSGLSLTTLVPIVARTVHGRNPICSTVHKLWFRMYIPTNNGFLLWMVATSVGTTLKPWLKALLVGIYVWESTHSQGSLGAKWISQPALRIGHAWLDHLLICSLAKGYQVQYMRPSKRGWYVLTSVAPERTRKSRAIILWGHD